MSFVHSPRRASGALRRYGVLTSVAAMAASAVVAVPDTSAATVRPHNGTSVVVVRVVKSRGKYRELLVTTKGLTLYEYTNTKKACQGSCLAIWLPLYMPKGTTTPERLAGLGTFAKKNGRLQVTYKGQRLYTYYDDGGTSTAGAGLKWWMVATEKHTP